MIIGSSYGFFGVTFPPRRGSHDRARDKRVGVIMQKIEVVVNRRQPQFAGKCKRLSPRVVINARAVVVMPRTGKPHPVLLHDISTGGASLQTDAELRTGDDIRLHVDIGLATKLVVDAIVIGVRPRPKRFYTEYAVR